MNLVISVGCVKAWGLIGVAIGTLISMLYQTIWMALYNARNLVKRSIRIFAKQCFIDIITVICFSFAPVARVLPSASYIDWLVLAMETAFFFLAISIVINLIFYRKYMSRISMIIWKMR